jgi:hypothetical protein
MNRTQRREEPDALRVMAEAIITKSLYSDYYPSAYRRDSNLAPGAEFGKQTTPPGLSNMH